ncbi:MAG: efflux RND transporter permease subunit, partial [Bacteroidales bacterium]|nr:efflux RND transporter permease subunit [Bacteroidales bacterium]
MIKFLINRPIAVSMAFLALVIVGLVSMKIIPISLMPDIDIPQITVKVNCPNASAREVEERYVSRMRRSLQQTGHLDEVSSTASNGKATLILRFKYGTNINYANLEVNEKVDALMSQMPEGFERPKVIKSKASDIPAFYVNVSLKPSAGDSEERFLELSDFTESVIKRRIEQLAEVALVDISGLVHPEIYIRLNTAITEQLGISEGEISQVLKANDVSIGNIKVKEGAYEYNLRYSSAIVERTDLENLLISAGDRVFKLKDVAEIGVRNQNTQGQFLQGDNAALTMAVIKKSDVQMDELQTSFNALLTELRKDYKRITIDLTRDQSAMLDVSIRNLRNTLILGGILAFIIVFLFLKDPKAPWLIGLTIPVSIIISILIFFLAGLSINIISLSGLVLGVGMMIDNAIIVIDNIDQHFKNTTVEESCVAGTN